jgi:uncharacterized integral membrane protein
VWVGAAIALVVALFIVLNRNRTEISFIFFRAEAALWVALTLAGAGGFLAGYLVSRRRFKR